MKKELLLDEWTGWKASDRKEKSDETETGKAGGNEKKLEIGGCIQYDFPHTADFRDYDCIRVETESSGQPLWMEIILYPLQSGRPEFIEKTKARVCLPPGCRETSIPFSMFDHCELVSAHMKYISSMEIFLHPFQEEIPGREEKEILTVKKITLAQSGDFHVRVDCPSKAGEVGECLEWRVELENDLDIPRYVTVVEKRGGRECMSLAHPSYVLLQPGETKYVALFSRVPEQFPAGGYEERTLEWIPDGDGSRHRIVKIYGARRMAHPVLIHTQEGWEKVRESMKTDSVLRESFEQEYEQAAMDWEVPLPNESEAWVYESVSQDPFLKTAVAWKVTGERKYFEKVLKYIQGFLDKERGYFSTSFSYFQCVESREEYAKGTFPVRHAVSAGWVQEGEFMTKLAVVCDLLWDCPEFTQEMHTELERCMRNYMEFTSWRLTDGDGNNFQLSEASAALLFACLLQDYPMIQRFLAGTNGLYELLGSVLSDDGSYFEGASNYMRLAAEILLHTAISCENLGLNLKDMWVPASHDSHVIHAPWAVRETGAEGRKPFLGMSFRRAKPVEKPVRRLKCFLDNLLDLLTPEGILFSSNDSNEQNLAYIMEMAYYLYRDEKYLPIARLNGKKGILFGSHMWESSQAGETQTGLTGESRENSGENHMTVTVREWKSFLNTGNGFALLRETGKGYVQAVMKYGQHGGYHGHYDRLSLVSLIKDGQTFHNMEFSWYSYASFLFKMWVQTSLAHNMVVVDRRMQEPSECECIYFREEEGFRAVCAQTVSRWSDPPYGGQTPYLEKFPEEKCTKEGRYILTPEEERRQGKIGSYSDPVFQRRLMILAGGCCFIWDYEEAEEEHDFECFYHPFGTVKMKGLEEKGFSEYLDMDPFGSGQFIRSCHWYEGKGTVELDFENRQKRVNPNDIMDFAEKVRLYRIYPQEGEVMMGRYPHRQDTFAPGENCGIKDLAHNPCKKAVAFRQTGKNARFITALEMGEESIQEIVGKSYEKVEILKKDGSRWEIAVEGMDSRTGNEIRVSYQEMR